ncbi:MAG: hypothetical protein HY711_02440 [Candidatus Melainabacteria bacterium]|nr:hypothetical protein [Candidatus Melainabacteria bacterium]
MAQDRAELWELVWGKSEIDPAALAQAIERALESGAPDFRTRLLLRDSTQALQHYWGQNRLQEWLTHSPVRARLEAIQREDLGKPGFPLLKEHLMDSTKPEAVKEFLRELGSSVSVPVTLEIGGSIALILSSYLSRSTEDIDVVNEVPLPLRSEQQLLDKLQRRYRLVLTHFQSHYLPAGWENRLQFQGSFGLLKVYVVDVYDICLGKLFSAREKDLDDLRAIKPHLDKGQLSMKLLDTTSSFLKDPLLRRSAEKNWYILFGEDLPSQK